MIGQEGVARAIVRRLKQQLNAEVALVGQQANASIAAPAPEHIYPYWVNLIEDMSRLPVVMVLIEDTDTTTSIRSDSDGVEADEYAHVYPVVIVIVSGGKEYGETELHRQRLMLAVRNCLLRNHSLIDRGDEHARLNPDSLREAPTFGAQNETTGQWLLESALRIRVHTYERLDALDPGQQATIISNATIIED